MILLGRGSQMGIGEVPGLHYVWDAIPSEWVYLSWGLVHGGAAGSEAVPGEAGQCSWRLLSDHISAIWAARWDLKGERSWERTVVCKKTPKKQQTKKLSVPIGNNSV